ncbi:MAG TPA: ABC transporter ATP-binding protein/permease [Phenylobacterium sp.]|nr:ABC transporter ATP-binding protein/permease [Phenylobacterium sp.]
MTRRFGDDTAPAKTKFSFWGSLADLLRLVMRSGAPQLRLRIGAALVLVFVGKLAGVIAPVMLGDAINTLRPVAEGGVAVGATFVLLALSFAALRLVAACAPYARDAIFTRVSQSTMAKAAVETFAHALGLSLDFHQTKQTGTLTRIIDRGSRSTDFLIRSLIFNLGPTAVELVMAMAVMVLRLDWRFAATALVTLGVYIVVTFKITDWRLSHRRELNETDNRVAGLSSDALINYETLKTFGAEDRVVATYETAMADYVDASARANSSLNLLNGSQSVILNIGLAALTVMAGFEVSGGHLKIGDVTTAILLLSGLYAPLGMLGFQYREIRQAFIDMEQMIDLRDIAPDITDAPDAVDLPASRAGQGAAIAFDHVSFRHDARSVGLRDVSFEAAPGTTVALVGPSGAGKTTAVRLAMRLLDPKEGRVLIDGLDMRHVRQGSLRRAVALVPQDVALFNQTLYANIAFARPGATDEDVRAAADAAELGSFIDGLPNGMSTLVGERGLKLSGGERQRVGIARALLANPRILILDEATSALDGPTEAAIQETLRRVKAGRTTLVIAHRLSTIVDADQILVLRRGRIVERGTHAELLARTGEYAALWRRQIREA